MLRDEESPIEAFLRGIERRITELDAEIEHLRDLRQRVGLTRDLGLEFEPQAKADAA